MKKDDIEKILSIINKNKKSYVPYQGDDIRKANIKISVLEKKVLHYNNIGDYFFEKGIDLKWSEVIILQRFISFLAYNSEYYKNEKIDLIDIYKQFKKLKIQEERKIRQTLPENAKLVFKGIIFDTYQWEQKLFDGTSATFEKLKRPDTVSIFPITPEGKIVIVKQQQPGREKAYHSTVGGRLDKNESVEEACKRELLEETGLKSDEFELFYSFQPQTKIDWLVHCYIAYNAIYVDKQKLDAGESIELVEISFDQLLDLIVNKEEFVNDRLERYFLRAMIFDSEMKKLKKLFKT